MSYTYLAEQGEESLAASFSDIPAYVLSRLSLTAEKSCCNGNETESFQNSQYGMMCKPLMETHGGEKSMLCAVGFHVRCTAILEDCMEALGLTDGLTPLASLEKSIQGPSFWKTYQPYLIEVSGGKFSETCPTWGMIVNGECFQLAPLVHHTHGKGCSAWRTPAASDNERRNLDWPSVRKMGINPLCLPQQIAQRGFHGYLNPQFQTALMCWPTTWANLQPLEMVKFHEWLNSHGKH